MRARTRHVQLTCYTTVYPDLPSGATFPIRIRRAVRATAMPHYPHNALQYPDSRSACPGARALPRLDIAGRALQLRTQSPVLHCSFVLGREGGPVYGRAAYVFVAC